MIRVLLLAALALGCGVKAAPRPPVKADAARAEEAAPDAAVCGTCGAAPAPRRP